MDGRSLRLSVPTLENYSFVVLPSPPDGNCFFHSVCRAFYISYLTQNLEGAYLSRYQIVTRFRSELASELDSINPEDPERRTYYSSIGGGSLEKLGSEIPEEFGLQALKSLLNSTESVGEAVIIYTSMRLRKSVYIIDATTRDVYITAEVPQNMPSIILWYTPGHYDLLALQEPNGQIITHFSPQHPVIAAIQARFREIKSEGNNPRI